MLAVGGVRVVEQRLHGVGLGAPGADGVVVDRRTRRQRDPGRALEERREPLDEVADDVAGDPALHRRRLVPRLRRGALDGRGERTGDAPVLVGRAAHRSSAIEGVELGVALVDAGLHAAGQPLVAALEAVDERLRVQPGAAVAEVLEPQRLERDAVGLTVEREGLHDAVLADLVEAAVEAVLLAVAARRRSASGRRWWRPSRGSWSSIPFGPTQRANSSGSVWARISCAGVASKSRVMRMIGRVGSASIETW